MAWTDFQVMSAGMRDLDAAVAGSALAVAERAPSDPYARRQFVIDSTGAMVETYGQAAHDLGRSYLTAVVGTGLVTVPRPSKKELVDAATGVALWAVSNPELIDATADRVAELLLPRLYKGTDRLVRAQGRGMLETVAAEQRVPVSARRIPQPGACAFCRMLSLNTYGAEESAGTVVGRAAGFNGRSKRLTKAQRDAHLRKYGPPRRTLRSGGKQVLGEPFHDHCKCEVHISYRGVEDDIPDDVAVMLDEYADEYYVGIMDAQREYGVTRPSTSQILARMRARTGSA